LWPTVHFAGTLFLFKPFIHRQRKQDTFLD
jgi:hypothetical protein